MIEGITLGEISALILFAVGLLTGINYLLSPIRKIKEDMDNLKAKQTKAEKEITDIHEFMYASLVAIKALLKHGVDNNDIDALKEASRNIDTYLNRKVKD